MAVGTYGTTRPSDIPISEIDMFYTYMANRETQSLTTIRLEPTELLTEHQLPDDEKISSSENLLEGMFDLKLPATTFNNLGIYNIYLKPKARMLTISDCGVLSALPTINGLLIDINIINSELIANNALQGYRVEYLDDNNNKIRNVVRYIVSSNKVVPVTENVGNTSQRAVRYRFDDSGTLLFLQLTPSSSTDVKPNLKPFIGKAGQKIIISNTFFNPIMIEVEMVENDIDTVVNYVAGEQIKDVDKGIVSYYDKNREIVKQMDVYEIKNDVGNVSLYEVKQIRENIDITQDFDEIISGVE